MKARTIAKGIYSDFLLISGTFLLLYFLYLIQVIIVYIVCAIIFVLIGRPLVLFLQNRLRFPKTLAVFITIFLLFALLIGLLFLFVPLVSEQGEKLALLNLRNMQAELELFFHELSNSFGASKKNVEEIVDNVNIKEPVKKEIETGFLRRFLDSFWMSRMVETTKNGK